MTEVFKLSEDYYEIKPDDLSEFVGDTRTGGFRFK